MSPTNDNPNPLIGTNITAATNPAGADYTTLESIANTARGAVAPISGQPYSVYRLNSQSNVDWYNPQNPSYNRIFTGYAIRWLDYAGALKKAGGFVSDKTLNTFLYALDTDVSPFLVGDLFVLNDPYFGAGKTAVSFSTNQFQAMCFCSEQPIKTPLAARIDRRVQIFRKLTGPDTNGYWSSTIDEARPVQLINGQFRLGQSGENAAFIPAGMMPSKRTRNNIIQGTVNMPAQAEWQLFVPMLQNFTFQEGDIIKNEDGDMYQVSNPWFQATDFVGNQLTIKRYVAAATST